MSTIVTRQRIRIIVDLAGQGNLFDAINGAVPKIWRGTDVAIECLFTWKDDPIDITKYASISLKVKPKNRIGNSKMARTVYAGDFTPCTMDEFKDGTKQHAAFIFEAAETNFPLDNGELVSGYWLVFAGITTDDPARDVTFRGGEFQVEEDGTGTEDPPPAVFPAYLTVEAADARYLQQGSAEFTAINLLDGLTGHYRKVDLYDGMPQVGPDNAPDGSAPNFSSITLLDTKSGLMRRMTLYDGQLSPDPL